MSKRRLVILLVLLEPFGKVVMRRLGFAMRMQDYGALSVAKNKGFA